MYAWLYGRIMLIRPYTVQECLLLQSSGYDKRQQVCNKRILRMVHFNPWPGGYGNKLKIPRSKLKGIEFYYRFNIGVSGKLHILSLLCIPKGDGAQYSNPLCPSNSSSCTT